MTEVLETLKSQGWYLKDSVPSIKSEAKGDIRQLLNFALDQDLTEIGQKYIQEKVSSSKDGLLIGPCVLQVSKIRNVSAPKENEHSNVAPRMLKISLTDGSSTVNAIEYEKIDQLSLKTPPGTKVKLIGSIAISSGLLQLQPTCVKVLGGKVDKLYTKWKIACDTSGLSRDGIASEGGPPPFVAFGKRVQNFNRYKEGTKSLTNGTNNGNDEKSEFDEQRKAAIAEVSKGTSGSKTFSSDSRTNFGKKPEAGTGDRNPSSVPDRRREPVGEYDAVKKFEEPQKSVGMYRELSTDSGENVHQRTVNEFVEMGFKRQDVVFCMRKSNNDFEMAMDMLVSLPGEKANIQTSNDRPGYRGRRGNERGERRGRGRGRTIDEEPQSQASNPATLFDFLESKISNVSIHDQTEPSHRRYENDQTEPSHRRYENDRYDYDRRNQQRADGREPGRGRGRGNSSRNEAQRGRGNAYHDPQRRQDNAYRGRGGSRRFNTRNDYQSNSTNDTASEERQYNDYRSHPRQPNRTNYENRDERNQNTRNRNQQDWGQGERNATSRQRYDDGIDGAHNRDYKRSDRPQRSNKQRHDGRPQNREANLPPRLSRNRLSHQDDRDKGRPSQQADKGPSKNMQEPKSTTQPSKRENFQTDGIPFTDIPINPPPLQRGPTTFGQPPPQQQQPPPPYSSTQISVPDRRLVPPPFSGPPAINSPQIHVTFPQWQIGSECMAKYWEDSQYYRAVITDIHPTVPTAVVQFAGFGNYEEVQLFDLKPVKTLLGPGPIPAGPNLHAIAAQPEIPQGAQRRQRNSDRPVKPALALYVPPKSRGAT